MSINTKTRAASTVESAIRALDDAGLSEFAGILRDEAQSAPARIATVASEINIRLARLADDDCDHPASGALSAIVREVCL